MKKINIFALIMATAALLASCNPEKDINTGDSGRSPASNANFSVDITSFGVNPTTSDEVDVIYTYNVVLSAAQNVDIVIPVSVVAGDATPGVDFDFDSSVRIPAGSTSAAGTFTVLGDEVPEATETFTIKVGNDGGIPNTNNNGTLEISCTITNFEDTALQVACAWDKEIDVAGTTYNFDLYDFDFYIVDSSFTFPGVGGWGGATSANPESFVLDGLADGTYYIFAQKYDAPHDFGSLTIPTRVTFTKAGVISPTTVEQEATYQWISWQSSSAFPSTSNTKFVTYFEVLGGVYTIYDPSGNIVAQG